MRNPEQPRRGWEALRDLLLISLAVVGLLAVGATTSVLERAHVWLEDRLGRLTTPGLVLAAIGLAAFALLRDVRRRREAERRLRDAEETYRALVERLPVVVYRDAVDDTSTSLYLSPQYERMLGYPTEMALADPGFWVDHLHPDDRERVVEESKRTNRTGEPFSIEYRLLAADGRAVWVRDEAVLLRHPDGTPMHWQGILLDVTDAKLAEERREEAELRYRRLVESIPAVTYLQGLGPDGGVTYMSPQLERLTGYTLEEWMPPSFERWVDSVHPDDRRRVVEADERAERTGEPFAVEYRQRHKDGRWVWIRDEAVLVHDDNGRPLYWQGIRFDITERRQTEEQLREAEARYRAIVEHIPAAIYVDRPDESMRTIYVSPQIEDIMGVSAQRFLDEPDLWLDLMAPQFREEMRRGYLEALLAHRSWRGEYQIVTPDGREVWVHDETTIVTDEDGAPLFVQGVLFDVTERKLAEQALRDSERREREAAERLRSLDEMKNTFLAAVSHELRSPLTSILGLSLTLEQQELAPDDRRDLTRRVAQNARKLDRLLGDLLDIDRLSRGNVTPKLRPTDLGALVLGTVESLELDERRVSVEAEPVTVSVDAPKVERIVENLVMNAVRHTEPDVSIRVRVWSGGGGAFLAVEDDGPGVPLELQSEIFEPFRQGPTATPHSPGTGIGLSLVAMFTELHGGRAWVEEREGGGASFRVFLPGERPAIGGHDRSGPHVPRSVDVPARG